MKRRFSTVALALVLTAVSPVYAFPTSRLIYERGPGAEHCPDEPVVRSAVTDRLGYDPFVEASAKTLVARVLRVADRLEANVELLDQHGSPQGSRHFSTGAARCDELIAAVALSISIAIDPERAQASMDSARPSPAQTSAANPGESPPELPASPVGSTSARPPPERDTGAGIAVDEKRGAPPVVRWHSGAGGLAAVGAAPAATGGAFVFFGARLDHASLWLEGRADVPAFTTESKAEVGSSLLVASLVPCWQPSALFACTLVSLGTVRGRGNQVAEPRVDSGFYAAAGIRLGSTLPLYEELALRFHLDLLSTLTRFTLEVDERAVWKAPRFSSAAGLALMANFP